MDVFSCHGNGGAGSGSAREEFTIDVATKQIQAIGFDTALCMEAVPPQQVGMSVRHRDGPPAAVAGVGEAGQRSSGHAPCLRPLACVPGLLIWLGSAMASGAPGRLPTTP